MQKHEAQGNRKASQRSSEAFGDCEEEDEDGDPMNPQEIGEAIGASTSQVKQYIGVVERRLSKNPRLQEFVDEKR